MRRAATPPAPRALLTAALLSAALMGTAAACGTTDQAGAPAPSTPVQPAPTGSTGNAPNPSTLPPPPEPVADGPCPYLKSSVVADANGQHVTKVRTSADKPHPACFFYRPDGSVQLTVQIYAGEPALAKAVVDEAAPIANSNPATAPTGWKGGSLSGQDGAVYAVAKGGTAVVVSTNQQQTIKARRVTETVITNLGL